MNKQAIKDSIKALKYVIDVNKWQIERLKLQLEDGDVTTQDGGRPEPTEPCPIGQIRNAGGSCVDDI